MVRATVKLEMGWWDYWRRYGRNQF